MFEVKENIEDGLREYFWQYDCEVVNINKCIDYLKTNNYIWEYEDIIKRFCENMDINCPLEYLDTNYIFTNVKEDYVEIGDDKYLCNCDFDEFDGIGDCIDKYIVIDSELLDKIANKYNITYDEIFDNIDKYKNEL